MNLLQETLEAMASMGKNPNHVAWVGSPVFGWFTWVDFSNVADVDYDPGYGAQAVAKDLIVMFTDGQYMDRGEYDGSEWWNVHPPITQPPNYCKPQRVIGGMWRALSEQNDPEKDLT